MKKKNSSAGNFEKIYKKSAAIGALQKDRILNNRIEEKAENENIVGPLRVISAAKGSFKVAWKGDTPDVRIPNTLFQLFQSERNFVAVGDFVMCDYAPGPGLKLIKICPRANFIRRIAPTRNKHRPWKSILAANIDLAIIVVSFLKPSIRWTLVNRIMFSLQQSKIRPVIFLNKEDLIDCTDPEVLQTHQAYQALGYDILQGSTLKQTGITCLKQLIAKKVSIVIGPSGAGKTSLVNHLIPGLDLRIGEVSEAHQKGSHTTSQSSMYRVPDLEDTFIIDSPGFKTFTMPMTRETIYQYFAEFAPYSSTCAWRGCNHLDQDGCQISTAVTEGHIHASRYASYANMIEELMQNES